MHLLYVRGNESFIKAHGKCKAFLKGGNSSCCAHIHQHYEVYKTRCKEKDITMNHWAIPRDIWRVMGAEKKNKGQLTKKQVQQQLTFETVTGPCEFTREDVLKAVTKLIATNNQVSSSYVR